ncbi:hypothetical protein PENSPDRAFT_690230 [Peniophora sp. CONT]|nr:hypothetical protein PENSPDRAFT_690230 [Peniophora sp. CONT]
MTATSSMGRWILTMMTPQRVSSIDIILESNPVLLLGATMATPSALLHGRVVLELTEPTRIHEVTMRFRGRARVPFVNGSLGDADPESYDICSESWRLFKSASSEDTLPAGTHTYPFRTFIGGSLPASTADSSPRGIYVAYTLRAVAVCFNQRASIRNTVMVPILRFLPCDSLAFFQSLDHEATIPNQLSYSLSLPHKAWAAGDTLTAIFHASMHSKGVSIRSIKTCLTQTRRVLQYGDWEPQVETIASSSRTIHPTPGGARVLKPIARVLDSESTPHIAECDESHSFGLTLASCVHHGCDFSLTLDLPIPLSTSPTHSMTPIFVEHHVNWTITVVDASGKARDHRCRLPLHILDHRLLHESVAATLASRLQALNRSSTTSFSGSPELPEVHTPPSYQAHVQDRTPELYVLPEVAEQSLPLLSAITATRSAGLTTPGSTTPSYAEAAKGFLGGLPPLELLRQLPSYAA